MNSFLLKIPYILIIIINFLYIYYNGLQQLGNIAQIYLINLLIVLLVAIFVIIKFNMFMSQWRGNASPIEQRQKLNKVLSNGLNYFNLLLGSFKKGNYKFLIKMYCVFILWQLVEKVIPRFLFGIFIATYFQYKGFVYNKFKATFDELSYIFNEVVKQSLEKLPYHSTAERPIYVDMTQVRRQQQQQ